MYNQRYLTSEVLERIVTRLTGVFDRLVRQRTKVDTRCIDRNVGSFIEIAGFEYLEGLLSLETDEEFAFVLDLEQQHTVNRSDRRLLLALLRRHREKCRYCRDQIRREAQFAQQFDEVLDDKITDEPSRSATRGQLTSWFASKLEHKHEKREATKTITPASL